MAREMKDSGIDWIGEAPSSWRINNSKTIFIQSKEKGNKELVLLSATQKNGMVPQSLLEGVVQVKEDADLQSFKTVHKDDYVISLRSFQGGFEMSEYEGVCSPAYSVFRSKEEINKWYYKYLFKSQPFIDKINSFYQGIREGKSIHFEEFAKMNIPIPPLPEQQAIADFLDKKCSEIDDLVVLQEKMIEELKAYKQSVITEAVTKGLDPNVPMKDSGIDCLGLVPKHWDVVLSPFVFQNMDYLREPISSEKRSRNNPLYDYYGASGVIDKIDYYNVDDEVLLIGEDGANLRMRNLPLIYKAKGKFWVNNHAHILKPYKDDYDYMALMLEALDYNDFITGSAQPKLSQDSLSKVKVCVPPLEEQRQIATFLDQKCSEIDSLIKIKQDKIEALKEYKKSIIYEYVTGKKEVV